MLLLFCVCVCVVVGFFCLFLGGGEKWGFCVKETVFVQKYNAIVCGRVYVVTRALCGIL